MGTSERYAKFEVGINGDVEPFYVERVVLDRILGRKCSDDEVEDLVTSTSHGFAAQAIGMRLAGAQRLITSAP